MGTWVNRSLVTLGVALLVVIVANVVDAILRLTPNDRARLIVEALWSIGALASVAALVVWVSRPRDFSKIVVAVATAATPLSAAALYSAYRVQIAHERQFNIFWQEPAVIEQHLLRQTPFGTSQESVVRWLQDRATALRLDRDVALRHPSANEIDGVVDIYQGEPFVVWVGGIYSFDASHRLIAIKVRKWADAP